jgi:hypothetical protein
MRSSLECSVGKCSSYAEILTSDGHFDIAASVVSLLVQYPNKLVEDARVILIPHP